MRTKDDKKHQAICDAAVKLITRHGFAETSMSKIAKTANVSPATLYIYFKNREDLLNNAYLMVKRHEAEVVQKGLVKEMSVEESFRTIWYNVYKYSQQHPKRFAFAEQFSNSPQITRISKDEMYDLFAPAVQLFDRGKKEGVFKNICLDMFGAVVFDPLNSLIKQCLISAKPLDKTDLATLYEITWDAVALRS